MKTYKTLYQVFQVTFKFTLYILFTFVIFQFMKQQKFSISLRIIYFVIMIAILCITVLFDYLKFQLTKLQACLIQSFDYQEYQRLYKRILKFDIFKGMRNDLLICDLFYNLDTKQTQQALDLMTSHEKFFKGSIEYLFIMKHSQLLAYHQLKNRMKIQSTYHELIDLKSKVRHFDRSQYKELFNWDVVDSIYYLSANQPTKALKLLASISTKGMNYREQKQLFEIMRECLRITSDNKNLRIIQSKIDQLVKK